MVQAGNGDRGATQSGSACRVEGDGVVREKNDGEVTPGSYVDHMVKDLGMGVDIVEKEDEENDDDAVYLKVGNVGSSFLECFSSVGRNGE